MKTKTILMMMSAVISAGLFAQNAQALSKDMLKSALQQADSEHEKAQESYRSHTAARRPEDGRRDKTGHAQRVRIVEDSYALSSSGQAFMAVVEDETSDLSAKKNAKNKKEDNF